MSTAFRAFVQKIGSGRLTGRDLSREEACRATVMLLHQEATPAQIGAFLIAHRIKRPTPEELAGILDAFDLVATPFKLPARLPAGAASPVVVSSPYDGQDRLANVTPLTALICSALGQGIVLHGTSGMPPKMGITSFDLLASLGIDLYRDPATMASQYEETGLGWVYLPAHFKQAHSLQGYREEIGKRPPLATAELFWNPVGRGLPLVGYTHRETVNLALATAPLRGLTAFTMVRGLQGSANCGMFHPNLGLVWRLDMAQPEPFRLQAGDYGLGDDDYLLTGDGDDLANQAALLVATLGGKATPLRRSAIFNSAFVLAQSGFSPSIEQAIPLAVHALDEGMAHQQLTKLNGSQFSSNIIPSSYRPDS